MSTRVLAFVAVFGAMMIAPKVVEPAYYLFLLAFAFLLGCQSEWRGVPLKVEVPVNTAALVVLSLGLLVVVSTWGRGAAARDVLRDVGAVFAFFVGRYMFVAYDAKRLQIEVLESLSIMGVLVSIATIGGAIAAYAAGASAYVWRGVYVLWAHTWIPYALVANVFLVQILPSQSRRWKLRAALCVVATVASLSRTDLLLEIGFGLAMLWSYRKQLLLKFAGFIRIAAVSAVVALAVPFLLQLDVVQQRISRGVGDSDQSLGWRFLENVTLYDYFMRGSLFDFLFGFGLGARLPLPPGVVDFSNNTSIPTLHNSFGTIMLKLGVLGLVFLGWYLWRTARRSFQLKDAEGLPYRRVGRWMVLICLGKALTLHGLTEWSHLVFFGIGSMLMLSHGLHETSNHHASRGVGRPRMAVAVR